MKNCIRVLWLVLFMLSQAVQAQNPAQNPLPSASDSLFIAKINIDCNHKTIDKIIFRELAIKEGQRVCRRNLDSLLEREAYKLMNTKLFILAELVPYHLKGDTTELIVSVIEKWYLYPIPIIDFADRSFNEWASKGYDFDRLIYGLRLVQNNFRGRNETLKFYMQLGFVRIAEFEYKIPYINQRQTTGLNFRVAYSNSKNSFYVKNGIRQNYTSEKVLEEKFLASVGITKRSKFYSLHKLNLSYVTGKIADSLSMLNPIYYANSRTRQQFFQLNYIFEKDIRDNIAFPLKGNFLQIEASQRGLTGFDDLHILQAQFVYAQFIPLSKKIFYSASWRGMVSFPQQQPLSEMKGYGFLGNFTRGMELNQIPGQHFAVWKNTLRWKMFANVFNLKKLFNIEQFSTFPLAMYPKVYADVGYVYSNYDYGANLFSNQTLWGLGAGMDFVFYNSTVLRLEYSPNKYNGTVFFMNILTDF